MQPLDFLQHETVADITDKLGILEKEKKKIGYNLLTISTYTSHLENYHSDVLAFILNPNGLHGDGSLYLHLFIDFLNTFHKCAIDKNDLKNTIVEREKGRIDVWIRDIVSKKSIIIENKINDAPDSEEQLLSYLQYNKQQHYDVLSIIYLSLDGFKKAPISSDAIVNTLVRNIAAFKSKADDLFTGWLSKCIVEHTNEDSYTFLYQYSKLLNHLSNSNMYSSINEQFYQFVSQQDRLVHAKTIINMISNLPAYRAERFFENLGDHAPFRKHYRWRPQHWLFENYKEGNNNFKLDVFFNEDGSAEIDFWNPGKTNEEQEKTTIEKMSSIGLLNEFITGGFGGGLKKQFFIDNYNGNIALLDQALLELVKDMLAKFNQN
jgi:hypothetical protein